MHVQRRKKQLQTFATKKAGKKQVNQLQRDRRLVQKCLHKKIKWSKQTGKPTERISEQYIPIPLAIATNDRLPRKGQKGSMTKCIESLYHQSTPPVMLNSLPTGWIPDACFLEGMFMINSVPLGTHRTCSDCTKFLIRSFIMPCFKQGSQLVHVMFDNPGRLPQTPKSCESASECTNT